MTEDEHYLENKTMESNRLTKITVEVEEHSDHDIQAIEDNDDVIIMEADSEEQTLTKMDTLLTENEGPADILQDNIRENIQGDNCEESNVLGDSNQENIGENLLEDSKEESVYEEIMLEIQEEDDGVHVEIVDEENGLESVNEEIAEGDETVENSVETSEIKNSTDDLNLSVNVDSSDNPAQTETEADMEEDEDFPFNLNLDDFEVVDEISSDEVEHKDMPDESPTKEKAVPVCVIVDKVPKDISVEILKSFFPTASKIQIPQIIQSSSYGHALLEFASIEEAIKVSNKNKTSPVKIGNNLLGLLVLNQQKADDSSGTDKTDSKSDRRSSKSRREEPRYRKDDKHSHRRDDSRSSRQDDSRSSRRDDSRSSRRYDGKDDRNKYGKETEKKKEETTDKKKSESKNEKTKPNERTTEISSHDSKESSDARAEAKKSIIKGDPKKPVQASPKKVVQTKSSTKDTQHKLVQPVDSKKESTTADKNVDPKNKVTPTKSGQKKDESSVVLPKSDQMKPVSSLQKQNLSVKSDQKKVLPKGTPLKQDQKGKLEKAVAQGGQNKPTVKTDQQKVLPKGTPVKQDQKGKVEKAVAQGGQNKPTVKTDQQKVLPKGTPVKQDQKGKLEKAVAQGGQNKPTVKTDQQKVLPKGTPVKQDQKGKVEKAVAQGGKNKPTVKTDQQKVLPKSTPVKQDWKGKQEKGVAQGGQNKPTVKILPLQRVQDGDQKKPAPSGGLTKSLPKNPKIGQNKAAEKIDPKTKVHQSDEKKPTVKNVLKKAEQKDDGKKKGPLWDQNKAQSKGLQKTAEHQKDHQKPIEPQNDQNKSPSKVDEKKTSTHKSTTNRNIEKPKSGTPVTTPSKQKQKPSGQKSAAKEGPSISQSPKTNKTGDTKSLKNLQADQSSDVRKSQHSNKSDPNSDRRMKRKIEEKKQDRRGSEKQRKYSESKDKRSSSVERKSSQTSSRKRSRSPVNRKRQSRTSSGQRSRSPVDRKRSNRDRARNRSSRSPADRRNRSLRDDSRNRGSRSPARERFIRSGSHGRFRSPDDFMSATTSDYNSFQRRSPIHDSVPEERYYRDEYQTRDLYPGSSLQPMVVNTSDNPTQYGYQEPGLYHAINPSKDSAIDPLFYAPLMQGLGQQSSGPRREDIYDMLTLAPSGNMSFSGQSSTTLPFPDHPSGAQFPNTFQNQPMNIQATQMNMHDPQMNIQNPQMAIQNLRMNDQYNNQNQMSLQNPFKTIQSINAPEAIGLPVYQDTQNQNPLHNIPFNSSGNYKTGLRGDNQPTMNQGNLQQQQQNLTDEKRSIQGRQKSRKGNNPIPIDPKTIVKPATLYKGPAGREDEKRVYVSNMPSGYAAVTETKRFFTTEMHKRGIGLDLPNPMKTSPVLYDPRNEGKPCLIAEFQTEDLARECVDKLTGIVYRGHILTLRFAKFGEMNRNKRINDDKRKKEVKLTVYVYNVPDEATTAQLCDFIVQKLVDMNACPPDEDPIKLVQVRKGRDHQVVVFKKFEYAFAAKAGLNGINFLGSCLRIVRLSEQEEESVSVPEPRPELFEGFPVKVMNVPTTEITMDIFTKFFDEMLIKHGLSPLLRVKFWPGRNFQFIVFRTVLQARLALKGLNMIRFGNNILHLSADNIVNEQDKWNIPMAAVTKHEVPDDDVVVYFGNIVKCDKENIYGFLRNRMKNMNVWRDLKEIHFERNRSYQLVTFKSRKSADLVVEQFNATSFSGFILHVCIYKPGMGDQIEEKEETHIQFENIGGLKEREFLKLLSERLVKMGLNSYMRKINFNYNRAYQYVSIAGRMRAERIVWELNKVIIDGKSWWLKIDEEYDTRSGITASNKKPEIAKPEYEVVIGNTPYGVEEKIFFNFIVGVLTEEGFVGVDYEPDRSFQFLRFSDEAIAKRAVPNLDGALFHLKRLIARYQGTAKKPLAAVLKDKQAKKDGTEEMAVEEEDEAEDINNPIWDESGTVCHVPGCDPNKIFTNFYAYQSHWRKFHVAKTGFFLCPMCNHTNFKRRELQRHVEFAHLQIESAAEQMVLPMERQFKENPCFMDPGKFRCFRRLKKVESPEITKPQFPAGILKQDKQQNIGDLRAPVQNTSPHNLTNKPISRGSNQQSTGGLHPNIQQNLRGKPTARGLYKPTNQQDFREKQSTGYNTSNQQGFVDKSSSQQHFTDTQQQFTGGYPSNQQDIRDEPATRGLYNTSNQQNIKPGTGGLYNPSNQQDIRDEPTTRGLYNPSNQQDVRDKPTARGMYNPTNQKEKTTAGVPYNPSKPQDFRKKDNPSNQEDIRDKSAARGLYNPSNQQDITDKPAARGLYDPSNQQDIRDKPSTRVLYNPSNQQDIRDKLATGGLYNPSNQQDIRDKSSTRGLYNPSNQQDIRDKPATRGLYNPSNQQDIRDKPATGGLYNPSNQQDIRDKPATKDLYNPSNQQDIRDKLATRGLYNPTNQKGNKATTRGVYNPSKQQDFTEKQHTVGNPSNLQDFRGRQSTVDMSHQQSFRDKPTTRGLYNPSKQPEFRTFDDGLYSGNQSTPQYQQELRDTPTSKDLYNPFEQKKLTGTQTGGDLYNPYEHDDQRDTQTYQGHSYRSNPLDLKDKAISGNHTKFSNQQIIQDQQTFTDFWYSNEKDSRNTQTSRDSLYASRDLVGNSNKYDYTETKASGDHSYPGYQENRPPFPTDQEFYGNKQLNTRDSQASSSLPYIDYQGGVTDPPNSGDRFQLGNQQDLRDSQTHKDSFYAKPHPTDTQRFRDSFYQDNQQDRRDPQRFQGNQQDLSLIKTSKDSLYSGNESELRGTHTFGDHFHSNTANQHVSTVTHSSTDRMFLSNQHYLGDSQSSRDLALHGNRPGFRETKESTGLPNPGEQRTLGDPLSKRDYLYPGSQETSRGKQPSGDQFYAGTQRAVGDSRAFGNPDYDVNQRDRRGNQLSRDLSYPMEEHKTSQTIIQYEIMVGNFPTVPKPVFVSNMVKLIGEGRVAGVDFKPDRLFQYIRFFDEKEAITTETNLNGLTFEDKSLIVLYQGPRTVTA